MMVLLSKDSFTASWITRQLSPFWLGVAELAVDRFGLEAGSVGEGDEEDGWAYGVLHSIVSI